MEHNHIEWLKEFREASKRKDSVKLKKLRVEIFKQTVSVVRSGSYTINGKKIIFNNQEVIKNTRFFEKPGKLPPSNRKEKMKISVIEADTIEAGKLLNDAGYNVCVLNMASRRNPGGGVAWGAGAQEENIFRRTNMFMSLYQFKDYAEEYGIPRSNKSYPLNKDTGGIYSPDVMVFRSSERTGYFFLKQPYHLSFVSVPAISSPQLEFVDGEYMIAKPLIEPTKEKIRTILRIAGAFNHDSIVLSAFGCGAFKNPPGHMAKLFKEVFSEPEFENFFKLIVFAIIDDHNSWKEHNPEGNLIPFMREFEGI